MIYYAPRNLKQIDGKKYVMKKLFGFIVLASVLACGADALERLAAGETKITLAPGGKTPVEHRVFGVNQLSYGKDSYGLLKPNTKTVEPEMKKILKACGVKSMRYPGGCGGTHAFDWKRQAGLKGGYPSLGLVEFLDLCEEIGAEPVLGVSAFVETVTGVVEFVQFLNAPDDGKNEWAALRAKRGHPAPYNVRYIEFGNESYHGNGGKGKDLKTMTPEEYAAKYLAFRRAVKAVDPAVELGVVLGPPHWNRPILKIVGDACDFRIEHMYHEVKDFGTHEYIKNFRFKKTLPPVSSPVKFAVTEFNATYKSHKSLTSALTNAQLMMDLCTNKNVFVAHYWQFCNEGFGMVRGYGPDGIVKRPNALMFELLSSFLLDDSLPISIAGRQTPIAAQTVRMTEEELSRNLFKSRAWKIDRKRLAPLAVSAGYVDGDVLRVTFNDDRGLNFFHVSSWFPVEKIDGTSFKLSAEVRVEGMEKTSGAELEIGDGRGFTKTRSIVPTQPDVHASDGWQTVSAVYEPLKDTKSLEVKVRRKMGGGRGTMFFRNVNVTRMKSEVVRDAVVAGLLTESADGKTRSLVLLNRSLDAEKVTFALGDMKAENVIAKTLTGPEPYATNETDADTVAIKPLAVSVGDGILTVVLPPHSLSGMKFNF